MLVNICYVIMIGLTLFILLFILADYCAIKKGKPSCIWKNKNGRRYRIVIINPYGNVIYLDNLSSEEAKEVYDGLVQAMGNIKIEVDNEHD